MCKHNLCVWGCDLCLSMICVCGGVICVWAWFVFEHDLCLSMVCVCLSMVCVWAWFVCGGVICVSAWFVCQCDLCMSIICIGLVCFSSKFEASCIPPCTFLLSAKSCQGCLAESTCIVLSWKTSETLTLMCIVGATTCVYSLVWSWRYLTRGLIWHLSQYSIRPSIYFSLIVKSRLNPFLEPTSTKQ